MLTLMQEDANYTQNLSYRKDVKVCMSCKSWCSGNLELKGNIRYCKTYGILTEIDEICIEVTQRLPAILKKEEDY